MLFIAGPLMITSIANPNVTSDDFSAKFFQFAFNWF